MFFGSWSTPVCDRLRLVGDRSHDRWSRSVQQDSHSSWSSASLTRLSGTTTPFCSILLQSLYYWFLWAMPWARLFISLWLLLPCNVRVVTVHGNMTQIFGVVGVRSAIPDSETYLENRPTVADIKLTIIPSSRPSWTANPLGLTVHLPRC